MDVIELLARMVPFLLIASLVFTRKGSCRRVTDQRSADTSGGFRLPPRTRLVRRRFRGEAVEFRPTLTPAEPPRSGLHAHPMWDRWLDG